VQVKKRRPLSRLKRLAAVGSEVRALQEEYEEWLNSLPESLAESDQASRLAETVEQLIAITDMLDGVDPPRGFGRD
jgi:hypothetical protein